MSLQLSGTSGVLDNSGAFVRSTAVASTSGTAISFTSIPSWVKRITVMLDSTSTSGSSNNIIQIGSGSYTTTGYTGSCGTRITDVNMSTGFLYNISVGSGDSGSGVFILSNISGNAWTFFGNYGGISSPYTRFAAGSVTLSGVLDRVQVTTANGTDTFDAGTINILYE